MAMTVQPRAASEALAMNNNTNVEAATARHDTYGVSTLNQAAGSDDNAAPMVAQQSGFCESLCYYTMAPFRLVGAMLTAVWNFITCKKEAATPAASAATTPAGTKAAGRIPLNEFESLIKGGKYTQEDAAAAYSNLSGTERAFMKGILFNQTGGRDRDGNLVAFKDFDDAEHVENMDLDSMELLKLRSVACKKLAKFATDIKNINTKDMKEAALEEARKKHLKGFQDDEGEFAMKKLAEATAILRGKVTKNGNADLTNLENVVASRAEADIDMLDTPVKMAAQLLSSQHLGMVNEKEGEALFDFLKKMPDNDVRVDEQILRILVIREFAALERTSPTAANLVTLALGQKHGRKDPEVIAKNPTTEEAQEIISIAGAILKFQTGASRVSRVKEEAEVRDPDEL